MTANFRVTRFALTKRQFFLTLDVRSVGVSVKSRAFDGPVALLRTMASRSCGIWSVN